MNPVYRRDVLREAITLRVAKKESTYSPVKEQVLYFANSTVLEPIPFPGQ
jgi:hypothetical protein